MVPFPSDRLLPAISIFQVMEAHHPGAISSITARMKQIGENRQLVSPNGFFEREDREKITLFFRKFSQIFRFADNPFFVSPKAGQSVTVNIAYAKRGNDLRLATLEYIARTNFPAMYLLTQDERKTLEMLPVTQVESELKQNLQQTAARSHPLPPGWLHP